MADHSAEIARIKAVLNTGAEEVVVDGQRTKFDLAALRQRLRELEADDDASAVKRPRAATIHLGGF